MNASQVVGIYKNFLSTVEAPDSRVSEKGVLQIMLDIRFSADILSGGKDFNPNASESNAKEEASRRNLKSPFRRKQLQDASKDPVMGLIRRLSQRLDPIDWAT